MNRPFSIREGDYADIDRCAELARLAGSERSGEWRDSLKLDLADPTRLLVVADTEDGIVGYGRARLFEPPPDAPADTVPVGFYLTGILVLHEERERGIGTALTRRRLEWIGEHAAEAWY